VGGGKVLVTYAQGKFDANTVAEEIRERGGQAEALADDVLGDAAAQLAGLKEMPSHVYYFATPPLVSRPWCSSILTSAARIAAIERQVEALTRQLAEISVYVCLARLVSRSAFVWNARGSTWKRGRGSLVAR
jgi:hypothetical protein